MTKRANIRDVAKLAGVSITAVSQIINGLNRYSDDTIRKVWDAVNTLNYTPNPYAKKIFSRDTSRIRSGLLLRITFQTHTAKKFTPGDHEAERMFYFERSCMSRDYFGSNYVFRHDLEFRNRLLLNDQLDGVVLGLPHRELITQISKRLPAVLTDVEVDHEVVGIPVINTDFVQGFSTVLNKLGAAGISGKMAILTGCNGDIKDSVVSADGLARDFIYSALHSGVEVDREHILSFEINNNTNREVMKKVVKKTVQLVRRDGVRIIGVRNLDHPARFAEDLEAAGLRLPEDVIIMTSADRPVHRKGIAVVNYDWEKMMEIAVDVLLHKIEDQDSLDGKYMVPCGEIEINLE